jgi:exosortase
LLVFPCAYLLLGFMSYALLYFSFHLRLLSTVLTAFLLNGLGIPTVYSGTALYSTAGGGFQFDVADPCSGLRSLVVMTALAAPYAYFTLPTRARQWALFLLSVPLALFSNTLRVVSIAVLAQAFGQPFAMRVYHDFSGYLLFGLSVLLLAAAGAAVKRARFGWRKPA